MFSRSFSYFLTFLLSHFIASTHPQFPPFKGIRDKECRLRNRTFASTFTLLHFHTFILLHFQTFTLQSHPPLFLSPGGGKNSGNGSLAQVLTPGTPRTQKTFVIFVFLVFNHKSLKLHFHTIEAHPAAYLSVCPTWFCYLGNQFPALACSERLVAAEYLIT